MEAHIHIHIYTCNTIYIYIFIHVSCDLLPTFTKCSYNVSSKLISVTWSPMVLIQKYEVGHKICLWKIWGWWSKVRIETTNKRAATLSTSRIWVTQHFIGTLFVETMFTRTLILEVVKRHSVGKKKQKAPNDHTWIMLQSISCKGSEKYSIEIIR